MLRDELAHNDQLGWTFVDSDEEARDGCERRHLLRRLHHPHGLHRRDRRRSHRRYRAGAHHLPGEREGERRGAQGDRHGSEHARGGDRRTLHGARGRDRDRAAQRGGGYGRHGPRRRPRRRRVRALRERRLLRDLGDGLARAGESVGGARTAVGATRATMAELSGTATSLADALAGARQHLAETRAGAQQLTADIAGAVGAASGTVAGISSTAAYDIGALAGDVGWAQGKIDAASPRSPALQATSRACATASPARATRSRRQASKARQPRRAKTCSTAWTAPSPPSTAPSATSRPTSPHSNRSPTTSRGRREHARPVSHRQRRHPAGNRVARRTAGGPSHHHAPALSSGPRRLRGRRGALTGAAGSVGALIAQTDGTLATLDGLLAQGADAVGRTAGAVTTAADGRRLACPRPLLIESARETPVVRDLIALDPATVGAFMGSPVSLVDEAVFPVRNYGSGVAPFYTNLALWVGGFVLVAIYKLEVDEEGIGAVSPWQATLGRGALIAALGQVQALICCTGDIALGMQCVSPAAFIGAGLVASFVYVSIVYALAVAFKHVGKALGVLLVVLQIPGASGLYPIQMQPPFFPRARAVAPLHLRHRRHARGGGGLLRRLLRQKPPHARRLPAAGGRNRARHASPLVPINALFDRSLAATDLMVPSTPSPPIPPAPSSGASGRSSPRPRSAPPPVIAPPGSSGPTPRSCDGASGRSSPPLSRARSCSLCSRRSSRSSSAGSCRSWPQRPISSWWRTSMTARARRSPWPESAADPAPNPTAQGGGLS